MTAAASEEKGAWKGLHILSPPQHSNPGSATSAPATKRPTWGLDLFHPSGRRALDNLPGPILPAIELCNT